MIDERRQEQASLYVLGALEEAERVEFMAALAADAELREYTAGLRVSLTALAGNVPKVEPPPHLRSRILARIAPVQKTVSLPERKPVSILSWLGFLTAGLAVACLFLITRQARLSDTIADREARLASLGQLADSLESDTNHLRQEVLALRETNRLVNLRVAMLNSVVTNSPSTVAVSLWDNQKQDGVFVAANMKVLPADQDYELWVIDENNTPVAAGVFQVDDKGRVRLEFRPDRLVKTAGTFAVTAEPKGGVSTPHLNNLVLAGN